MTTQDDVECYESGQQAFRDGTPCFHAIEIPFDSRRIPWMAGWMDALAERLGALYPPPDNCRFKVVRHDRDYAIRDQQEDELVMDYSDVVMCGQVGVLEFGSHAEADKRCKAMNVEHLAGRAPDVPSGKRAVDVGE